MDLNTNSLSLRSYQQMACWRKNICGLITGNTPIIGFSQFIPMEAYLIIRVSGCIFRTKRCEILPSMTRTKRTSIWDIAFSVVQLDAAPLLQNTGLIALLALMLVIQRRCAFRKPQANTHCKFNKNR